MIYGKIKSEIDIFPINAKQKTILFIVEMYVNSSVFQQDWYYVNEQIDKLDRLILMLLTLVDNQNSSSIKRKEFYILLFK